jgi:hypothetical protein
MRVWPFAAAALLATGTAAQACQCEDPATFSAKDIEDRAQWIAGRGFVIAEVERLAPSTPNDEHYRVIRPLAGSASGVIRVDRFLTHLPNGQIVAGPITSCDYSAPPGLKRVMAFTRGGGPDALSCGVLGPINAAYVMRPAGMCTQFDLENPAVLKRVLELVER